MKVTVVDTLTGEVTDFKWSTPLEMKNIYLQINNQIAAFERAKKKVAAHMDAFLGDQDRHDFGDGYELMRISRATRKYPREVVAQYLDEDQLALVTDVSGTKLKDLIKKLAAENQLQPGTWKAIEEKAEITMSKPYVKLQKVL